MDLQIRNLSKTYANGVHALKDVSLTIPAGMYGLLGPNGAGKSTLMRTLATLQEPDRGSVHLGDVDVLKDKERARESLGYLPQEFGVYPRESAERLLEHFAVLKGLTDRRVRRETVEHPFGTIKARMGATHFLMKRLPNVAAEMALHVLAYNLTRLMNIMGRPALVAAMRAA